jgi:hypothetical protein
VERKIIREKKNRCENFGKKLDVKKKIVGENFGKRENK